MTRRVITIVREDGEVDYLYEETVKYSPPPYKVEKVGLNETESCSLSAVQGFHPFLGYARVQRITHKRRICQCKPFGTS